MDHWLSWAHLLSHLQDRESDLAGYVASALVLATFSMKSMTSLRVIAVFSNVAFIIYAVSADIRPVLVLHTILLPVNVFRLVELVSGRTRRLSSSSMPRPPTEVGTGARNSGTGVEASEFSSQSPDRSAGRRDIWLIPSAVQSVPHK